PWSARVYFAHATGGRLGSVQDTTPPAGGSPLKPNPEVSTIETNVEFVGMVSVNTTLCAASGPLLETNRSKVVVEPSSTSALALLVACSIQRSATVAAGS